MLTRKGVYPNQCMDCWEKFNEIALPEKLRYWQLKLPPRTNLNTKWIIDDDYINNVSLCAHPSQQTTIQQVFLFPLHKLP